MARKSKSRQVQRMPQQRQWSRGHVAVAPGSSTRPRIPSTAMGLLSSGASSPAPRMGPGVDGPLMTLWATQYLSATLRSPHLSEGPHSRGRSGTATKLRGRIWPRDTCTANREPFSLMQRALSVSSRPGLIQHCVDKKLKFTGGAVRPIAEKVLSGKVRDQFVTICP